MALRSNFKSSFTSAISTAPDDEANLYKDEYQCFTTVENLITIFAKDEKCLGQETIQNRDFFSKENRIYSHPIVQQLFDSSLVKEHSFFVVKHLKGIHAYVIEKECNGFSIDYRIHQSWEDYFTLGEWEGIDPWPAEENDEEFKRYGRWKKLVAFEVEAFLREMIVHCNTIEDYAAYVIDNDKTIEISAYPVSPIFAPQKDNSVSQQGLFAVTQVPTVTTTNCASRACLIL